jgi:DnaJ-class molecular chaperone
MKQYYTTLSIPEDATQDEIKESFKYLSKIYHPDKHGGSERTR